MICWCRNLLAVQWWLVCELESRSIAEMMSTDDQICSLLGFFAGSMMYSKSPSFYSPQYSMISRERQGASIESVAARSADNRPQQSLHSNEQPQTLYWSQDTQHWPHFWYRSQKEFRHLTLYPVSIWAIVSGKPQAELSNIPFDLKTRGYNDF